MWFWESSGARRNAGLRVVKGEPLAPDVQQSIRQTLHAHAEALAEAEHNHWMVERISPGGHTEENETMTTSSTIC
jgi:hypothetical protein